MYPLLKIKSCTHYVRYNLLKRAVNSEKFQSTQAAVEKKEDSKKNLIKEYEKISNITQKIRTKKPQKPPFVKNLFVGQFDTDILTYPELEKNELEQLNKNIGSINSYFHELSNVNEKISNSLSKDVTENLRRLQLFGLQTSQLIGGRELTITEHCRFNEVMSNKHNIAVSLINSELVGVQALLKYGTDNQKKKYLPHLTAGNILSALCISEEVMTDPRFLETKADLSSDKKTWILNGEKTWILNGNNADLLIVLAQTNHIETAGFSENKTTAFLVERSFGGITSEPCSTLGLQGADISNVKFKDTPVPAENILGKPEEGHKVVSSLLTELLLATGPICCTLTRTLLDKLTNHFTHAGKGATVVADSDFIRNKIAKISTWLYAMESITYLTSNMLDQYENQDCEAEAIIVKVFSSEMACRATLQAMEIMGTPAYMDGHWSNQMHKDVLSHVILNNTNENLKIILAVLGLQHAGVKLNEKIKMIRNPLFNPAAVIKRMWTQRRNVEDRPKLTLNLGDYLHPSTGLAAEVLEYCVLRLQFATEVLLVRHGPEIVNMHMQQQRLAECAIDIFAMTACLGRASRSYCIGLQNADLELLLASTFCWDAMKRVKDNVKTIWDGDYTTTDQNYRTISKRVFNYGKYCAEHPLTSNY